MDMYEVRHSNLQRLIKTNFRDNQTTLAMHLGIGVSQVNRWLASSSRHISDRSARLIEEKCGKPFGWLDVVGEAASDTAPVPRSGDLEAFLSAWVVASEIERSVPIAWARMVSSARR